MSRPELMVLLHRLGVLCDDLRDVAQYPDAPQHVVQSTEAHIDAIRELAAELRRLHGVGP